MPTQPPDTPTADEAALDGPVPTHRRRAATFDEAVALAQAEFGEHVEVIAANRIRRGGIGGFFATDLGVEITVRPAVASRTVSSLDGADAPAAESAIDRLLALVDAQERAAREPVVVDRNDFAAALAHELRGPGSAPMSSADWSVEAYRRLAIPATPHLAPAADEPAVAELGEAIEAPAAPARTADRATAPEREGIPARASGPRSRRHASRNLAARLEYAARVAVEPAGEPDAAVLPFVTGAAFAAAALPDEPTPVAELPDEDGAPVGADEPDIDVPDPAARPEPVDSRPAGGEAAAHTMDLVTQAATALFSQLGTMPIVAGSQAANVRKLTVSVTSPLGKVIEISAELGDQGATS